MAQQPRPAVQVAHFIESNGPGLYAALYVDQKTVLGTVANGNSSDTKVKIPRK